MRSIAAAVAVLTGLMPALPAAAHGVEIVSAIYHERSRDGARTIEPATRLLRGDRVITILRWDAPEEGGYTATSTVPPSLAIESASLPALEISGDGGRSWKRLGKTRKVPAGTTHLRWQVRGEGRLSYRAVVR